MVTIVNPFAGHPVGWTWAQHQAAGFKGGTDYEVAAGVAVTSPCAGHAIAIDDGLNTIEVVLADGRAINIRELRSRVGSFPRAVALGEEIGITGRVDGKEVKWPHIDSFTKAGVRVPFEPLITQGTSTAGTGTVTPIGDDMLDAADQTFLNQLGQSIIDQIRGTGSYGTNPLTIAQIPAQVWQASLTHAGGVAGPAANWLMNISDAIGKIQPGGTVNIQPVLDALTVIATALGTDTQTILTAVAKTATTTQLTATNTQLLADLKAAIPALPKSGTISFP